MATTQELEVAAWIAALVKELDEVEVGPATERDGRDNSGLTNDFTFEEADPRIAIEVTRLRDDFESPPAEEQSALRGRLERFVIRKEWPHWTVGFRPETHFRSELVALAPSGRDVPRQLALGEQLGRGDYAAACSGPARWAACLRIFVGLLRIGVGGRKTRLDVAGFVT